MSQAATSSPAGSTQAQTIQSALHEISHIATLPEVTMRIIRLVEDPDSTAQDLNQVISNDPALGARILKVVNSAFYGLPGQIGSINRAIVLLGLNAVKNIAIAASLAKLFRGGRICPGFDAREFWMHSIGTATASRLLSAKVGLGLPDEAFLAGLIHDIGVLVEIQARRPKFVEVIEKLEKDESLTLRQAEDEIIGANHELFGAALCRMWKFPASFAYVTGFHHHPMDLQPANRTLAAVVHIAHTITAQAEIGYGREVENKEISPEVLDSLKLSMQQVDEVIGTLAEATEEARTLFPDVAP